MLLLFATGTYTALVHMHDSPRFVASPYGSALGAKLGVVLVIVSIAAANRFWLLPTFLRDRPTTWFSYAVRTEAILLVTVFVLTGALTTTSPPHDPGAQGTAAENLAQFLRYLTAQ